MPEAGARGQAAARALPRRNCAVPPRSAAIGVVTRPLGNQKGMAKSVVVTGANSGIGLATAVELASSGYDVIGTVRAEDKAALVAEAAARCRSTVRTVLCDVS